MKKKDIVKELIIRGTSDSIIGTINGFKNSEKGWINTITGMVTGTAKGTINGLESTYNLLEEYIKTSNYIFEQRKNKTRLKILNNKYLMEIIEDTKPHTGQISASIKHLNPNTLEAKVQFSKEILPITITLYKNEEKYSLKEAYYGNHRIYTRI
jgi:hypothetical protein